MRAFFAWIAFLLSAAAAFAQPPEVVEVTATPDRAVARPGEYIVIAVIFAHAPGWHIHTNAPVVPASWGDFEPVATEIMLAGAPGVSARAIQWPAVATVNIDLSGAGKPAPYAVFGGRAVAFAPVRIDENAPAGDVMLSLDVAFQACDDAVCQQPTDLTLTVPIRIEMGTARAWMRPASADFDAFDPAGLERAATAKRTRFDFFGKSFSVGSGNYAVIFLLAFVAGLLLNLTPCVLPVIPLKILSLQAHAKLPGKLLLFGMVYCVGIVATFLVLGLLIFGLVFGGQKQDWGQIFTSRWFVIAMAAIVTLLSLSMLGLFTIRLPERVYFLNPANDTVFGNFALGVLTAVLSTPCTGPLLGATIAWAVTQPAWVGLVAFVVMGIGMAAPYALLIFAPKLVDKLPRAGPGGDLLKQILGILMLAVAAFLFSNLIVSKWPWWVVGGIVMVACVWAISGAWRRLATRRSRIIVTVLACAALVTTAFATNSLADEGPLPWKRYYNQPNADIRRAVESGVMDGDVVVVDFTAKWCTNCHIIEKTILNSEAGVALLTRPGVTLVRVDLTNAEDDTGFGLVKEISGGGGIPLIAVYKPGAAEPVFFNSFFTLSDLEAAMRP